MRHFDEQNNPERSEANTKHENCGGEWNKGFPFAEKTKIINNRR